MGRHSKYEAKTPEERQRLYYEEWKKKNEYYVECSYCGKRAKKCFLPKHQKESKKCQLKQEIASLKNMRPENTKVAVDNREGTA